MDADLYSIANVIFCNASCLSANISVCHLDQYSREKFGTENKNELNETIKDAQNGKKVGTNTKIRNKILKMN